MRPSICVLCGKPYIDETGPNRGSYVKFADYRPGVPYTLIEAVGKIYFCDEHVAMARSLASLPMEEALAELENRYGPFPRYQRPQPRPGWLKRIFSFGKHSWAP